jgi:tetratricopeptide (TPR) repeat protein
MMTKHKFSRALLGGMLGTAFSLVAQAQTAYSPADRDAMARSAYARGDVSRAATALNESVRVNPFDAVALNNLAVNYAAQGDYQNALSLLERALRIAPNRSDIMNNHANLRAWITQDSQFALGSRPNSAPLNFPRAEDTPGNFPPLWVPPPQMQNPPVVRSQGQQNFPALSNQPVYPNYPATNAQQGYGQLATVPAYNQGQMYAPVQPVQQGYAGYPQQVPVYQTTSQPVPVYQQAPPAPQAVLLSNTSHSSGTVLQKRAAPVQQSIAPQNNELVITRKKKRTVPVDCKVEP